jgi:peptidoglycan/xylan/chitin deacetylase (PgdA/CDA1 family)
MKEKTANRSLLFRAMIMFAAVFGMAIAPLLAAPPERPGGPPTGGMKGPRGDRPPRGEEQTALSKTVAADAGSAEAPLLFCIGMHIEPFGAKVSELVESETTGKRRPEKESPDGDRREQDFNNAECFGRHVESIKQIAEIMRRHNGKLTVQAQTPFSSMAAGSKNSVLADLAAAGHEIALHFHEDAHLGRRCDGLPAATWTKVMKEEIDWLHRAAGPEVRIRYWSGGNNFPGVLEAAAGAGLQVMSDHKNPRRQATDEALLAINPWRPAGGPSQDDMKAFARHDPNGAIVYLPDGIFASADFHARKQGGDGAYFDFLTDGLERSLRAARKDRVNVFHITVHSGEFRGRPDARPFEIVDQWLTKVLDPLVKAGKVRWATLAEMAAAYAAWEKNNRAVDPRAGNEPKSSDAAPAPGSVSNAAVAAPAPAAAPRAYMTFAINVHDSVHVAESAATIMRAAGIFKKYKVRGDFYFTAQMAEAYAAERPEAVRTIKESGMTVSYHVRPPHPTYIGFDKRLKGLDDAALNQTLKDYETYRLDPATGELQKDRPGGYRLVASTFGCNPVCVSPQSNDRRIKSAVDAIYKEMGARMVVQYHETGTRPEQPFEYLDGLLLRPSDFSITRWPKAGESEETFWWNRIAAAKMAEEFNPTERLKKQLAEWKGARPPFITSLIHENNFSRRGPEAWVLRYSTDTKSRTPRDPPYKMDAPDESKLRSAPEQETIWQAYEALVAYAAANLCVVTSAEIVKLAEAARPATTR